MEQLRGCVLGRLLGQLADGEWHSRARLIAECRCARATLYRAVAGLRQRGLAVKTATGGGGYRLSAGYEPLDALQIAECGVVPLENIKIFFRPASTNELAMAHRLIVPGKPGLVLGECQIAGRGRAGRAWSSPLGGLYLSLVADLGPLTAPLHALGVAVAVALVKALRREGLPVSLKWPNDILLEGSKVAGILAELRGDPRGGCRVVVGVGLNCFAAPRERPAAPGYAIVPMSYRDGGVGVVSPWPAVAVRGVGRNRLGVVVSQAIAHALQAAVEARLGGLLAEWADFDALQGEMVRVSAPGGDVVGVAAGIDMQGRLLLRGERGLERFSSAEVRLRSGL
ncbi:biotin--[acetyl-CoA-carboxylase] ligase [Halorhodospira abdelmalekii]|uniref:biotin--[acetyl-CoA-carboxylase] ligase n=1 Tax=Halorhodospira abdelmalekii TaxID=421629 RepID=UPI0019055811|nr:biotin--[acetyl-CoA-carboxylase] ligase [Halorhodospira abdelmalekii]MBK1734975.1 biotin--[acetyl-CoA-carboxylase] ligase [Halorhodospira abdelmalekii]